MFCQKLRKKLLIFGDVLHIYFSYVLCEELWTKATPLSTSRAAHTTDFSYYKVFAFVDHNCTAVLARDIASV